MIARYRKKPVVIEAIRWNGTEERWSEVMDWIKSSRNVEAIMLLGRDLCIQTLEGRMTAIPGDWIIKGIKGEFYPCKSDIFDATYEPEEAVQNIIDAGGF